MRIESVKFCAVIGKYPASLIPLSGIVTRSVSEEKLVSSRRVQSLSTTEVLLTSGGSGNAGFLALSLVRATPVGTVPAATVEIEREVDDATALVRATARFSLRSSAFSALLECKMQGCAPWSHGFQARPLCSPQGDTFQNARLAYDAGDSRPAHDIDGVPAVTHAIDLLMPSMTLMVCVCTASRRSSCVLAVSQISILLVAQRLEHSFLSSLQEKGQLLFRIISVRYSLSTAVRRGRP